MSKGWISISRSLEDSWIFEEPEALKFWMALLMKANWETKTTMFNKRLITVERGQVVFGRKAWSERLKISEKKLRRYLELLIAEGMVGQQTTSRYSMITVLNYDEHQEKGQPRASQGPAEGQPRATSKQLNNITIKQEKNRAFKKPTLDELLNAFSGKVQNSSEEANKFLNFYESKGWVVGKTKMKSWQHSVTNWITRSNQNATSNGHYQTKSERADQAARDYLANLPQ